MDLNRKCILITNHKEDRIFVGAASKVAKVDLAVYESVKKAFEENRPEEVAHCFVNVSDLNRYRELENFLTPQGAGKRLFVPNQLHFIAKEGIESLDSVTRGPLFGSFIRQTGSGEEILGALYGRILGVADSKQPYMTDRYLNLTSPSLKKEDVTVVRTVQKYAEVEKARQFFLAQGLGERIATIIANAVDELLMNAMFDAPIDGEGKPLFDRKVRTEDFALTGKQSVKMTYLFDGEFAAITVKDLFGSINKAKLMKHISKSYANEPYRVGTETVGAGLGLATVFQTGGSLAFHCEHGVRSMVSVFFRKTDHFREFKEQVRFISTRFSP